MQQEGMVHALEEIHRLLRPSGTLIEIRPIAEPPTIEVRSGTEVKFAERDTGYDYEDDLRHAEDAVVRIARRGRFVLDGSRDFDFFTHAPSVEELRNFFAVNGAYDDSPKDETVAARQDELYGRVEELITTSRGKAGVVYNERARANRMTPVP